MARSEKTAPAHSRLAPWVEAIDDTTQGLQRTLGSVLDLILRLWLAQIFFRSGLLKTINWEATLFLYTHEHPVPGLAPATAAGVGTAIELIFPILLAIGLATRISTIPLLLTTAFLQLTYKALDAHLLWMLLLGLIFARGAGALSLDHAIAPHLASSAVPFGRHLVRIGELLSRFAAPVVMLIARLFLALFFSQWVTQGSTETGLTTANVPSLALAAMLAIGLATRLAAGALLCAVLAMAVTDPDASNVDLLVMLLAFFVLFGGGALAVDRPLSAAIHRAFPSLSPNGGWLEGAPRVVIVGGGFGGLAASLGLRHAWTRVTLIDRRNYHLFQPLLYQVATASLSPADIAVPIRTLIRDQRNCQVIMGRVTAIDTEHKRVMFGNRSVAYDYLILASGAKHSYFGKDEWEPLAPGLKKIDDATAMRGRILLAFERAETTDDVAERQALLTFVIVGGGPTGVELAGAISELARHGLRNEFRSADPASARVILVQSAPRVLPAMPEALSEKALRSLGALGVEVLLNSRVEGIDAEGVTVNGERIAAKTVLWAAGVTASAAGRWINAKRDNAGRIIVNADLSVPDREGVYAIGDTAACPGPTGTSLPGLAAVAKQQGRYLAQRLRATIEGRPLPGPFRYRDYGSMATIGRKAAVAALPGVKISGSFAWWLWGAVHVAFLVDVRSRIAVLFDWFWSYVTYSRGVRLITGNDSAAD